MKRREFAKTSGVALAGVSTLGAGVLTPSFSNKITIGVIGTGDRGGGLISLMNEIPGLEVMGCCDVLPFRLESGMKKANTKVKGYSDYRKLLDNKDIDAVIVSTPFSTHEQIAMDALDAGKHVYCEKTMAKGFNGIQNLVQAAKNANTVFQTGHQYHSSRLYTHVVDLIKDGKIGRVVDIVCQWNRNADWRRPVPNPKYERAINWRMYKEFSGGLLAELCSHQLDLANWILDAVPLRVIGEGGIDYWKDGRETYDNVHMIYTYPNGVRAKFTCLTSNAKDDYQIKILGDKGTITLGYSNAWFYPEKSEENKQLGEVDGVSGATLEWDEQKGIPIKMDHLDPTKQALMDFESAVVNNQEPISSVETGAKAAICVQMGLDALYNGTVVPWKTGII
ncbi:Gfo/Idh/MocA family protein [Muricauda sp. MAR_2010_75]|uniref:Gfo/Idh/MocA family protein n=1 Tax=Allomuricauda sp. MAR_2010_75 TaxID=1250232 RepID=UPI0005655E7A|nr:Gfo/Idh/MocA family oxidoreductase [Muricauda sp. MAR_2010_75]